MKELKNLKDPFVADIISRQSDNYSVEVIADTIWNGNRITTLQLKYPRIIHGEMMTHKRLSRNAKSSRAIPTAREIENIKANPYIPIYWGKRQAGMQAKVELSAEDQATAMNIWLKARDTAVLNAHELDFIADAHKQVTNRLLEPFMLMETVVTATDWDEFFKLRIHPDAQPEIIKLAHMMYEAINNSKPLERYYHLPYLSEEEIDTFFKQGLVEDAQRVSSARCARVSYKAYDGSVSIDKDFALADDLFGDIEYPHASPAEHPALAADSDEYRANMFGWLNYRTELGI